MSKLIEAIVHRNFDEANTLLEERINNIMKKTLFEMKKAHAAKMSLSEASWLPPASKPAPSSEAVDQYQAHKKAADEHITKSTYAAMRGDLEAANEHTKMANQHTLEAAKIRAALTEGTLPSVEKLKRGLTEDDGEELSEARVKIIKARIRNGKIQRRKKVSNVSGFTLRGGKLTKMSPAERRKRKLGAKRAKIKRRAKMSRTLQKRKRSLMKRKALGI